ncbi:MAG: hypothetical protein QM598_05860 [Protaetiibacter sp.]
MQEQGGAARFFTRARRIPIYVGKLPGNKRIPFGPYRISQMVLGIVVLLVGWNTRGLWGAAVGGGLVQLIALAIVTVGVVVLAGQLPSTRRSLPGLVLGTATAFASASSGSYRGRPVKLAPPHRVVSRLVVSFDTPDATRTAPALQLQPAPISQPVAQPPAAPPTRRFATGLDRLLEQAERRSSDA